MSQEKNLAPQYEESLVAFIDILGFSSRVKQSLENPDSFAKIDYALEVFNKLRLKQTWKENNILIEVEEDAQRRTINDYYIDNMARCFCFSDSIIITVKADEHTEERCSALIAMLSKFGANLLAKGILIRGALSIGKMYIDKNPQSMKAFGPAVIDAYKIEEEQANYPRMILSQHLIDKLAYPINSKKQRQPYHQYIERFEDGLVGFSQLTFFQVMQNAEQVLPKKKFIEMYDQVKKVIIDGLDESMCNVRVFEKYRWLKNEFNSLAIIDDEVYGQINFNISDVGLADSRHNIHYSYINDLYDNSQRNNQKFTKTEEKQNG